MNLYGQDEWNEVLAGILRKYFIAARDQSQYVFIGENHVTFDGKVELTDDEAGVLRALYDEVCEDDD